MFTRYSLTLATLLGAVLLIAGCADLDVENLNAPDAERAITDASDLQSVLAGGYTSWWNGSYSNTPFAVPQPHLDGWGDAQTTTNAFRGFWNVAVDEPRSEFPNTLSFGDLSIVASSWSNLNSAISSANDVIFQIDFNDFEVIVDGTDETQESLAAAYFLRGLAYGHLANYYNQAFIVGADFGEAEIDALEFSDYQAVLAQARADIGQARDIAEVNAFTMENYLPFSVAVTSERLVEMANSFEARFIVSNPRTPAENDAINWNEIRTLAANGIQESIVMELDGTDFFNNYQYVSGLYWYWRVDNRIINMMDDSYPIKYPAGSAGNALAPAQSDDQRLCPGTTEGLTFFEGDGLEEARELGCYFAYETNQAFFREERGPTLQSNYFYARDFVDQQWNEPPFAAGPGPIFLLEENRLMEAEAAARTDDVPAAVTLVNDGSRVNIGGLDPLAAGTSQEDVLTAIFYERDIELYRTGMGLPFYDLRRRGQLQAGTPLHLPVPATELQTLGEALYTFGGVGSAGQPGTASGDNAWCDQGDLSCDGPFTAPLNSGLVLQEAERLGPNPSRTSTMPIR
jgi:starch-binding outer membrane protein, SusD/RagB family